jgi:tryptophanase
VRPLSIDFVAEAVVHVAGMTDELRDYRIGSAPKTLRHFTASFVPL